MVRRALAASSLWWWIASVLAAPFACRDSVHEPPRDIGASCVDARDCDTGLCVDVGAARLCTKPCVGDEDCPEEMTCQRFSLAQEGDAGPIGEAVRACAPAVDGG